MPGLSPGMTKTSNDAALGAFPRDGRAAVAPHRVVGHLARPPERVQLADDGPAAAVSGGAGRVSILLRHSLEPAGPPGRACWHLCRAEEFHDRLQGRDLLAC